MSMFDNLNLGNMGELMKKARQMGEQMKQMQEELGKRLTTADAGGGMVQATVNGRMELIRIRIDKTKVDPADIEMLEDLIVAAVGGAQRRAADNMKQEMERTAGDMGLPPGLLGS